MKIMLRVACVFAMLICARTVAASCADVADVSWDAVNIDTLRTCDKTAIEQFVNALNGDDPQHIVVGEFRWLPTDGTHYRLAVTADLSGRDIFDTLAIYARSAAGKVHTQSLYGVAIALENAIRDLDGDGKAELVVPSPVGDQDARAAVPTAVWPKVYRLRNGNYDDASAEFGTYYRDEVLPKLDKAIDEARKDVEKRAPDAPSAGDLQFQQREAETRYLQRRLAALEMTRDKILRVSGLDPNAGLDRAREWTTSSDTAVIGDAVVVLRDMGGHPDALRAAQDALGAAR